MKMEKSSVAYIKKQMMTKNISHQEMKCLGYDWMNAIDVSRVK